jgi:hypothetical protein
MANRQHSLQHGSPLSDAELNKVKADGVLRRFLELYASSSRVRHFDDFLVDTINLDHYAVAAGATATTWAVNVQENGVIRGVTGTTAATSGLQVITPKIYYGDRNCGFEIRLKSDVVEDIRVELGFVNALPSVNTTVVNSLATPSFNTSVDTAMYVYDEDTDVVTMGLYGQGNATPADNKTAFTTNALVAETYSRVRLQLVGNDGFLWVDGQLVASKASLTEGGNAQAFAVSIKNDSTTTQNVDIDYIHIWQDRA